MTAAQGFAAGFWSFMVGEGETARALGLSNRPRTAREWRVASTFLHEWADQLESIATDLDAQPEVPA